MGARLFGSIGVSAVCVMFSFVTAQGCGDTEESSPTPSAADATTDGKASDGKAGDSAAQSCGDASLSTLAIPDAALGDAGATTQGCFGCIKTNCNSELTACQEDCDCSEAVLSLLNCVASGKAITGCGAALISAGPAGQSLGFCALNSGCTVACGQGGGDAGAKVDTGTTTDASTDAPADGG